MTKKKRELQASEQAAYRKKIAALNAAYIERKAAESAKVRETSRKQTWRDIKKSIPRIISLLPTRSHSELLAIFQKCVLKMAGRSSAEISPDVLSLHGAVLSEWERRTKSLLAGEDYFKWPTTDAPRGDGNLSGNGWRSEGMLSSLGYHVGVTEGRPDIERQFLLDQAFEIHLPPLNDQNYMAEWGVPKSVARLRKLAETIAALTRNAKRRRSRDLGIACDEWQADLDYLYPKYYVRRFRFAWPTT